MKAAAVGIMSQDAGLPGAAAGGPGGSGASPSRPGTAWSPDAKHLHAATSAGVGGAVGHASGHHNNHERSGAGNGKAVIPKRTKSKKKGLVGQLNPWGGNNHPLMQMKGALTCIIKTGSREGAGTDARIWMRVHGKEGSMSPVFELSRENRHSFS